MADMNVQILIQATTEQAQKAFNKLATSIKDLQNQSGGAAASLDSIKKSSDSVEDLQKNFAGVSEEASEAAKSATNLGEAIENIENVVPPVEKAVGAVKELDDEIANATVRVSLFELASTSLSRFGQSLDQLEKRFKKFGREMTQNVSLPILAIAGISLKNLYDEGAKVGSSGAMRNFALSIQTVMDNFKALTLTIAKDLLPVVQPLLAAVNNLITGFNNMDEGTRKLIIGISLFVAAIGPAAAITANILAVFSQLAIATGALLAQFGGFTAVVKTLFAAIFSIKAAIAGIVFGIAGLVNLILDLKKAGVETPQAILDAFKFMAIGLSNLIGGTIIKTIGNLTTFMGNVIGKLNKNLGDDIKSLGGLALDASKEIQKSFDNVKDELNAKLKPIGQTVGNSLTLGIMDGMSNLGDKLGGFFKMPTNSVLNSEITAAFSATFAQIQALSIKHNEALQQIAGAHKRKMRDLSGIELSDDEYEERFAEETAFLQKKHAAESQAAYQTIQLQRDAAAQIKNIGDRRLAEKKINEEAALEITKLTQTQEVEAINLANAQVEQAYQRRVAQVSQYANVFASTMTNSFMAVADGTKSLGEALEDFAKDFVKQVTQMVMQAYIYQAVMSALPGFSTGGPARAPGGGPGQVLLPTAATGGYIQGPGTGTSDSILARLSNGEYVMDAKTVRQYGVDFFRGLQSFSRSGVSKKNKGMIPGFADGGLVGGGGSMAPQVIIQNSGQPKDVESSSYDPATAITSVILSDIQRNGSIARSLQNTYNFRRSAAR